MYENFNNLFFEQNQDKFFDCCDRLKHHFFSGFEPSPVLRDTSNFITDEAVIDNIIYSDRDNSIILWLSEIDEIYQDCNFKINASNTSVVLDSGFRERVHIGDRITYVSAPAYFGNGYIMPIVAISVDGIELLSFLEGYKNLMESY